MKLNVVIADKHYRACLDQAHCIAIAVQFNGPQPNHFGVPEATAQAIEDGGFIGDTRRGGSCNVDQVTLVPHCNGTHTECVGHIVDERLSVHQQLKDVLLPATLITVSPEIVSAEAETYVPSLDNGDLLITQAALKQQLEQFSDDALKAVVVRTLPNGPEKQALHYDHNHYPAFFSNDAIRYLNQRGVEHLLVDFPSVDRMYDEGQLSNHHQFWQIKPLSRQLDASSLSTKTITEMVYIAPIIADGLYLLSLQIAPFDLDAAPSRPILIPLKQEIES